MLACGVDIDKEDLRRYNDFVKHKPCDLLLRGQANAKANGRDVIQPWDLPITKGLQESIHALNTCMSTACAERSERRPQRCLR
jgi:hypothetical protein